MNLRHWRRAACALMAAILLAPVMTIGAFALSSRDPLLHADLSRADFEFSYTPFANSEYALYIFSADGGQVQARAELMEAGEVIAGGEGFGELFSAWLVAGTQYSVRVHGSGKAVIEVARSTLSRCYLQPLEAHEDAAQGKIIARAYDAHWYAFTAEASTLMMLSCIPEEQGLALSACLFDEDGALISEFEQLPGGACMLLAGTEAGRRYYLRVCAPEGGTGYYALNLNRSAGPEFDRALRFDQSAYTVAEGGALNLAAHVEGTPLLWAVEDTELALITQDGSLHGLREGQTRVTAYGMSSSASCMVNVEYVPLEGLRIDTDNISLAVGEQAEVGLIFTPENSSARRLRYIIADGDIASVSSRGVITGLTAGETSLTVRSADGGIEDSVRVTVTPAQRKYRALLIGEESYPFSENSHRTGSANSVNAIEGLLGTVELEDGSFSVRKGSDLTRAELIAEIRAAFSGAAEQDVSLIYITCHGSYEGGMSFLELSDGSTLSMRDLERELRAVPGSIVLLIDCCGSGGAIGAVSDRLAFARGVTGAFSGAAIRGSKYKVLCSAALDEDSYRIAFNENADTGVMTTVFARALCDGAGWSVDRGEKTSMGADRNYDGKISFDELHRYMAHRVNWYLEIASGLTGEDYRQSVQAYPEGDPFVLFGR